MKYEDEGVNEREVPTTTKHSTPFIPLLDGTGGREYDQRSSERPSILQ